MLLRSGDALQSVRIVPVLLACLAPLAACQTPIPPPPRMVEEERLPPALEALRQRANAGDANAARTLGVAFEAGRGVRRDYAAALQWYERAAALGSPAGLFAAGLLYDTGRGVPVDHARALAYYQRAAAKGFGPAEYRLAMLSEKTDRALALRLYKSAAAHGVAKAQQRLAALTGQGSPSSTGFDQAQSSMLAEGVASGSPQALRRLQEAAQKQDALAQYDLGYFYENGIGLPADKVKAFVWYKRAAEAPGPPAAKAAAERGAKAVGERLSPEERTQAATMLGQPLAVSAPQ